MQLESNNKMYLLCIQAWLALAIVAQASSHTDFKFEVLTTLEEDSEGEIKCLVELSNNLIASGSHSAKINIWNTKSGSLVNVLSGHTSRIVSLASLENDQLASASTDSTIRIWSIHSGEQLRLIEDPVSTLVSLNDGRLVSASKEQIKIWDIESGFLMNTLNAHEKNVFCLAFMPKNNLLASGSSDKTIKLWDTYTFELKLTLAEHESSITTLVVMPNGLLASGSWDHSIRLWNVSDNAQLVRTITHDQMYAIRSLASLKNNYLASGSYDFSDSNIYIWNSNNGSLVGTLSGHTGPINTLIVLTNGHLVSGSSDKKIKIWKLVSHAPATTTTRTTKSTTTIGIDLSKKRKIIQSTTQVAVENQIENQIETTAQMQTYSSQSVSCWNYSKINYLALSISLLINFSIKWLF